MKKQFNVYIFKVEIQKNKGIECSYLKLKKFEF